MVPHKAVCGFGSYLAVRSPAPGPFFVFEDGGVLSREWLVTELSTALQEIRFYPSPYKITASILEQPLQRLRLG